MHVISRGPPEVLGRRTSKAGIHIKLRYGIPSRRTLTVPEEFPLTHTPSMVAFLSKRMSSTLISKETMSPCAWLRFTALLCIKRRSESPAPHLILDLTTNMGLA